MVEKGAFMTASDGRPDFFEITDQHMWPSIRPQDKIIVVPATPKELHRGDLVIYREKDALICHRLLRKVRATAGFLFWVRGDAMNWGYETIDHQNLVGRVTRIIRDGKVISQDTIRARFFNWGALIFAPLFMLFFSIVRKRK